MNPSPRHIMKLLCFSQSAFKIITYNLHVIDQLKRFMVNYMLCFFNLVITTYFKLISHLDCGHSDDNSKCNFIQHREYLTCTVYTHVYKKESIQLLQVQIVPAVDTTSASHGSKLTTYDITLNVFLCALNCCLILSLHLIEICIQVYFRFVCRCVCVCARTHACTQIKSYTDRYFNCLHLCFQLFVTCKI